MKKLLLLSAVLVLGSLAAQGRTIVLTFEGLKDVEQVLNYYNGGFGGSGSGPGPNYGITFSPTTAAVISKCCGGVGPFFGAPSMPTAAGFLESPDIMDVPAGITTGFSFFYSSPFEPGTVSVWSGPNKTGTELTSLSLPVTPNNGVGCPPGAIYCPFVPIGVSFAGTAMSVDFNAPLNDIVFDNITLGSSTPVVIPEPGTLVMFGSGIVGLAGLLRRKFLA
jgi:hypothetical protein